jgi:hypothetical protein
LLKDVENVGVLRKVAKRVSMAAGGYFAAIQGSLGFENGFVELALFEDFGAIRRDQVADVTAKRIDRRLCLRRVEIDV